MLAPMAAPRSSRSWPGPGMLLALALALLGCTSGDGPSVQAAFSATPVSGVAPLVVQFTDESTGDVGGWDWSFGDGEISPFHSPTHTYTSPGTYTVTLHAISCRSPLDCTNSFETKTDLITVTSAAEASMLTVPRAFLQGPGIVR